MNDNTFFSKKTPFLGDVKHLKSADLSFFFPDPKFCFNDMVPRCFADGTFSRTFRVCKRAQYLPNAAFLVGIEGTKDITGNHFLAQQMTIYHLSPATTCLLQILIDLKLFDSKKNPSCK